MKYYYKSTGACVIGDTLFPKVYGLEFVGTIHRHGYVPEMEKFRIKRDTARIEKLIDNALTIVDANLEEASA